MVESLLTLRTLVLYGLALDYYHVLHSSLVTRLQRENNPAITSSIICLLSAFLSAAVTAREQPAKTVRFSEDIAGGGADVPLSLLHWTHVAGLIESVYGLVIRNLKHFTERYSSEYADFNLDGLVSSLDFVCLYLTHARTQPVNLECAITPQAIVTDMAALIGELLKSTAFNKLLSDIRASSILMRSEGYILTETSPTLPSLFTVPKPANTGDITAAPRLTHQLLTLRSIVCLLATSLRVSPAVIQPLCKQLVEHTDVVTYIRRISQSEVSNSDNYLSLIECCSLAQICQLAASVSTSHTKELHKCSLALVPKFTSSALAELHQLFTQVVFSQTMFRNEQDTAGDHTLAECLKSLPSIANTYVSLTLPLGEQLQKSRNQLQRNVFQVSSMLVRHNTADLLPADWPFMPIMHLYQTSNSRKPEAKLPPDTCLLLKNSLQFIYLLERCQPDVIKSIGVQAKVARVMCSFLLDNDLFLQPDMQELLMILLRSYCQHISRINFNLSVPGLYSFSDLYAAFIDQFEATSFGNNTFSQYLLLPMMQQQDVKYRKSVWTEHALTLRSILLSPKQLLFPVEDLLYPEETDGTTLMYMCRHLIAGTVTSRRNPLMYLLALHHVNRFMFTCDGKDVEAKQSLLKAAQLCTAQTVKDQLIFYKEYKPIEIHATEGSTSTDMDNDCIVCYDRLPASRCSALKSVQLD